MFLHFSCVRSAEDFNKGFFKEELVSVNGVKVYCQELSTEIEVTEPCIWISVNGQYDVWQLQNETIVKDSNRYEVFKKLCESLVNKLYLQGFSNGNFRS